MDTLRERLEQEARIWDPSPLTKLLREAAAALPTALKAEHARYKAGLEDIEELLTGELRARFGPAEAAPKSSRIVGLLRIPRNMARAALAAAEQGTP